NPERGGTPLRARAKLLRRAHARKPHLGSSHAAASKSLRSAPVSALSIALNFSSGCARRTFSARSASKRNHASIFASAGVCVLVLRDVGHERRQVLDRVVLFDIRRRGLPSPGSARAGCREALLPVFDQLAAWALGADESLKLGLQTGRRRGVFTRDIG